jgi:hypothetical protein
MDQVKWTGVQGKEVGCQDQGAKEGRFHSKKLAGNPSQGDLQIYLHIKCVLYMLTNLKNCQELESAN